PASADHDRGPRIRRARAPAFRARKDRTLRIPRQVHQQPASQRDRGHDRGHPGDLLVGRRRARDWHRAWSRRLGYADRRRRLGPRRGRVRVHASTVDRGRAKDGDRGRRGARAGAAARATCDGGDDMNRELTKAELEAQIRQKEQRLGADLGTASTEVRERFGYHFKVTLPVSLTVLTTVGLVARKLGQRRRARAEQMLEESERVPIVALVKAVARLKPRSLVYGALLFGAGALLGRRRRPQMIDAGQFYGVPSPRAAGDVRPNGDGRYSAAQT